MAEARSGDCVGVAEMKPARRMEPTPAPEQALAIGEIWWVRFKGIERVRKVEIADLHERFVALRHSADGGPWSDGAWLGWFERRRIKWLQLTKASTR